MGHNPQPPPYAPFPRPVPIPGGNFDSGDLFFVAANGEWWAVMLGALALLTERDTWDGDDEQQQLATEQADRLLASISAYNGPGSGGMAIGSIFPYATSDPPAGAVPCDGTVYADTDYPDFWAVINPAWKTDATHWAIDARDLFMVGAGNAYNPGDTGGLAEVALTGNQIPSHYHGMGYDPGSGTPANKVIDRVYESATRTSTFHNTTAYGSNQPHENRPPFLAFPFAVQVE